MGPFKFNLFTLMLYLYIQRMSQIEAQIQVLNKDYTPAQISWRLGGVKYVINRDWFENAGDGR